MAHFDVPDAAKLCLILKDERTRRGHRNEIAIGPRAEVMVRELLLDTSYPPLYLVVAKSPTT
jgi:hypothetical protein